MIAGVLKMGFLRRNLRAAGDYFFGLNAVDHYMEMRRIYRQWCPSRSSVRESKIDHVLKLLAELTLKTCHNVATGIGVYAFA